MNYLSQAKRGLLASKSRTLLTTLGIVIGIATVIVVLSAGEGFKSYINAQIEQFGSNAVTIETRVPPTTRARASGSSGLTDENISITTLKQKDIDDIALLPNVDGVYGAVIGQQPVTYQNVAKNAFIFGSNASRFDIDKGKIASGRGFTTQEERSLSQVVVLGSQIASDLFGDNEPLGNNIRVGNYNFRVIGVYEPQGGIGFANTDEQIFMPASTLQKKILGIDHYFYLIASLIHNDTATVTRLDIEDTLRRNHSISDPDKDDFLVQTQDQNLSTFGTILSATTFLLIAIAAISLIVGGVGVMNIMYVMVTERTSEIGLKKALGATNKNILLEFLYEAVLITLLGGVLGVLVGVIVSFGVAQVAQAFGIAWKFSVPILGVGAALFVSTAIGIIFGVFPARNASRLNPIEALRYE